MVSRSSRATPHSPNRNPPTLKPFLAAQKIFRKTKIGEGKKKEEKEEKEEKIVQ
jgi:hypothetical protein